MLTARNEAPALAELPFLLFGELLLQAARPPAASTPARATENNFLRCINFS